MIRSGTFPAAALIAWACSSAVLAAEFPQLEPLEETLSKATTGWYLRLDAGYSFDGDGGGTIDIHDPDVAGARPIQYDRLRLGWRHDIAVGAGYRFSEHLRGDLTLGHWSRDVDGVARYSGINNWIYAESANLDAWEMLANAYVDLGRLGRFTPYLGGGAGAARLEYGTLTNKALCACGFSYTGLQPGLTSTRATFALMAGTAVDITPLLKLDVGYRFSHIDSGKAFGWDQYDTAAGLAGTQIHDEGFSTHQLRIGLRKEFR